MSIGAIGYRRLPTCPACERLVFFVSIAVLRHGSDLFVRTGMLREVLRVVRFRRPLLIGGTLAMAQVAPEMAHQDVATNIRRNALRLLRPTRAGSG